MLEYDHNGAANGAGAKMEETRVGVRELKARLSAVLRLVQAGHPVTVTQHGRPVGRLVPIADSLPAAMAALAAAGLVDWSGQDLAPAAPSARVRGPRSVADLIVDERQ